MCPLCFFREGGYLYLIYSIVWQARGRITVIMANGFSRSKNIALIEILSIIAIVKSDKPPITYIYLVVELYRMMDENYAGEHFKPLKL